MKQLLLHVGVHKTGSTSIQKTLNFNSEQLFDNGIKLYSVKVKDRSIFYRAFTDTQESFHGYYRKWNRNPDQQQLKVQLKSHFLANTGIDHLVSSEDISLLSVSALSCLNRFLYEECGFSEITVVCFLREPLDYLNSSLQQFLKPGLVTLNEILNNTLFSYRLQGCPNFEGGLQNILSQVYFPIPQKLVTAFGKENVRFVKFESAAKTGLVQSVLNNFEHHENVSFTDIEPYNTSISHEACLLLAEYNNRLPALNKHMNINSNRTNAWVISVIRSIPGKPVLLVDPLLLDFSIIESEVCNINEIVNSGILTPISRPPDKFKNNTILTFSRKSIEYLHTLIDISGINLSRNGCFITPDQLMSINLLLESGHRSRWRSRLSKLKRIRTT